MSAAAQTEPTDAQETVDLAELGRAYTPPQQLDTSPEVSDVIARMPWWAARGLVYIIAGFIVVALVWASLSMVDVVAESRGTLVPEGYVRPVQAAGRGVVQHVFVKEGEVVERGQPLVQLDATEMRTRLAKLREELETSREQLRQSMSTRPVAETLEQQNRVARLQSDIAAAELSLQHTTVMAPVSGKVTTLGVRGPGSVLQEGQTIATVAPAGARLLVEARVPNRDIAFIEEGLTAKLKFDAFPFQDYGTVDGTVIEVGADARAAEAEGDAAAAGASFYKVMIAPERTSVSAKGKEIALKPGLELTAEIVTERKSVLELLLEPFRKLSGEAGGQK